MIASFISQINIDSFMFFYLLIEIHMKSAKNNRLIKAVSQKWLSFYHKPFSVMCLLTAYISYTVFMLMILILEFVTLVVK